MNGDNMGKRTTESKGGGLAQAFQKHRRWVGATLLLGGAGMSVIHYIDYGFLLHWPVEGIVIDHGVVGILLVIIGAIMAAGKPRENIPKPP